MEWNCKEHSGVPVSQTEKSLLSKGKQFCPVELDPPVIRMQKELNAFFRILRIKWHFDGKTDDRTELETKFYQKSVHYQGPLEV